MCFGGLGMDFGGPGLGFGGPGLGFRGFLHPGCSLLHRGVVAAGDDVSNRRCCHGNAGMGSALGARLKQLGVPSPSWVLSGESQAPDKEPTHHGDAGGWC